MCTLGGRKECVIPGIAVWFDFAVTYLERICSLRYDMFDPLTYTYVPLTSIMFL